MNRREFLRYCATAGMAMGFGSLVFCAAPKASLTPADKAELRKFSIADAHAHPYKFHGGRRYDGTTPDIEMLQKVGMVACSFAAVGDMVKYNFRSESAFGNTMSQLIQVQKFEKKNRVQIIRRASDVPLAIGPTDAPGAILAIEGGDALQGKISNLNNFFNYGVRMLTLVHDHNNEIGFNQRSQYDGPLKPFGIKVVERMNELGMIIDVAHAKLKTLKSISKKSATPLVDSHTNPLPYGLEHTKPTRLRTWAEMELVAKTGGVICTWPLAYAKGEHKRTTLQHWAAEIVEMKQRLGMEHVGLGTDGGGGLPRKVDDWKSIMSLPKLIEAMREVGLSQEDIKAYVGGNFSRVLDHCLG